MAIQHISQLRCVICGTPRNWRKAVHALRESKGEIVAVSDDEIMDAMNQTARMGAVFGEPSGAASVAGVKRAIADGVIKKSDSVSAVITGDGLKDIKAAIETAGTPMNTFALTNSGLTGPVYFLIYGYKVGARRALGGSTTKTSRAA